MDKRSEPRFKKRVSCEITLGEKRYSGVVLDVSSHGLFVQTAARPEPKQPVRVSISVPGRSGRLVVDAVVARAKLVPPQLRNLAHGGIGLSIPEPTPAYAAFVRDIERPAPIEKVSILPGGQKPRPVKKLTRERLDSFFSRRPRLAKLAARRDD